MNYDQQSISIIISAYGEFWSQSVFFLLASLKRQLYDLNRVQIIVITETQTFSKLVASFPQLSLSLITVSQPGHYKNRYLREALAIATNQLIIFLDGDIIIPNYTLSYADQILRLQP